MKKLFAFVVFAAICIMGLIMVSPVHAVRKKQESGSNPTATATITRDPSITSIPLIVGIGQSNMAGKAPLPVPSRTPPPGAVMMKWDASNSRFYWTQMEEPADVWNGYPTQTGTPKGTNYGYGASTAFIGRFMEDTGWQNVAFINCGVGGTDVVDWAPSNPTATNATYFNDCWKRIASAQSHYLYEVVGVIVINGENETANLTKAATYETSMVRLYEALAGRLNKPRLPMAFLRLGYTPPTATPGPTPTGGHMVYPRVAWNAILATQQYLPIMHPTINWGIAYPINVTREPDNLYLHYASADDYDKIGVKLADKLELLLSSTPLPTPTSTPTLTPTRTPTRTPTP